MLLQLASMCQQLLHLQCCYRSTSSSLACQATARHHHSWSRTACRLSMAAQQQRLELLLQASACLQGLTKVQCMAFHQALWVLKLHTVLACHQGGAVVLWGRCQQGFKVLRLLLLHSLAWLQCQQGLMRLLHPLAMLLEMMWWLSLGYGAQRLAAATWQTMMTSCRSC